MFQSMLMMALLLIGATEPIVAPAADCQLENAYAYETVIHTAYFGFGEIAQVSVIGDGDTNLDVYVYDPFGTHVAYDNDASDISFLSWWAMSSGRYTIKVTNRGFLTNQYQLCADGF